MAVDDLSPAASRMLLRAPAEELEGIYEAADHYLERLFAEGKLLPLGPWVNAKGEQVESWVEADGDTLACYRDMLGLNDRTIVEYTSATAGRQRAKRRAQLLDAARG